QRQALRGIVRVIDADITAIGPGRGRRGGDGITDRGDGGARAGGSGASRGDEGRGGHHLGRGRSAAGLSWSRLAAGHGKGRGHGVSHPVTSALWLGDERVSG